MLKKSTWGKVKAEAEVEVEVQRYKVDLCQP
jgi:hypothetical protein